MPVKNSLLLALLTACLEFQVTAWADTFPRYTVDAMCNMADVIIEGTYLGGNIVQIDRIHKSSPALNKTSKIIEVEQLQQHDIALWRDPPEHGATLATRKLALFLMPGSKASEWASIATIDADGGCGSCGLFWFDDSTCYGYMQTMNPGPYGLFAATHPSSWQIPLTISNLRADIATGLANSSEWRRSLALQDPSEKAQALARYLLNSTSPLGDKGTFLYAVREPMAALGKSAVPALIQVLRNAPANEKLDPTVLILYDIGQPATPAIPDLCALLTQPERVYTGYILAALGSTGNPSVIPILERYLNNPDIRLVEDATRALKMLRSKLDEASKYPVEQAVPGYPPQGVGSPDP